MEVAIATPAIQADSSAFKDNVKDGMQAMQVGAAAYPSIPPTHNSDYWCAGCLQDNLPCTQHLMLQLPIQAQPSGASAAIASHAWHAHGTVVDPPHAENTLLGHCAVRVYPPALPPSGCDVRRGCTLDDGLAARHGQVPPGREGCSRGHP